MDLEELHQQTCLHLAFQYPDLDKEGISHLVSECFTNAQQSFQKDFMLQLSPQAWASITLIYTKHFLDVGVDFSIGDMFATVIRDSIKLNRFDMLTLQLAQTKRPGQTKQSDTQNKPSLTLVDIKR